MNHRSIEALVALSHLLQEDMGKVTWQQEEAARIAIHANPGDWELLLAVKRWAAALADVCRSYAGKCAEIHRDCDEKEPATAAMKTLLLALCAHLGLPSDTSCWFTGDWPESCTLRRFVLYVSDAPIDLIDGELVTKQILPRWHPKRRRGWSRTVHALESDRSEEKSASAFLSIDETQYVLRGLEESFRNVLWEALIASYGEAVLASCKSLTLPIQGTRPGGRNLNYRSALKRAIALKLTREHNSTDREICNWLDEEGAADLPAGWTKSHDRSFLSVYLDPEQKHKVESTITKVRRDMRRKELL